jgi:putative phosphonate metabolism protein
MRVAIYATPPAGAPLTRATSLWLGRDAFSGETTRGPDPAIDPIVAEPARYGFHATMRAPFRIAEGYDLEDVDARLADFCASRRAVILPEMELAGLGRFFALVPAAKSGALADLEAALLDAFEPLRAPSTEAEIARRKPDTLTERQKANLAAFGYPHVLDDFRFHMTLTGPVPEAERSRVSTLLAERFAAFDGAPLAVDSLALFVEPEPGAPFRVHSLHHFGVRTAP